MKYHIEKYKRWRIEEHIPGLGYLDLDNYNIEEKLGSCDNRREAKNLFDLVCKNYPSTKFRLFELDISEKVIYIKN